MTRGQSRIASGIESLVNVLVGYWVAVLAQVLIFPLFGWRPELGENLAIAGLFTVISLVRSFALRRFFNWLHIRAAASKD